MNPVLENDKAYSTNCTCYYQKQKENHRVCQIGQNWYIELPMIFQNKPRLFEMALWDFCPRCKNLEYRILPTGENPNEIYMDNVYLVISENDTTLVTRNREKAKAHFVEMLKTYNNPFSESTMKKCKVDLVPFYE